MKKLYCVLLALVFAMACPLGVAAQSAAPQEISRVVTTDANGMTTTTTIVQTSTTATTKSGYTSKNYSYGGTQIASVYLYAQFTYNGTTASATAASSAHSVASGWTYSNERVWYSGATAYLTATLTKGVISVPVSLSLTCSPNGTLS